MPVPPFLPPQLPWLFDVLVGQEWPQADEDAVRRLAQDWTDALGQLVAIADGGNNAAQRVGYSVQSVSSDQFDQYWSQYTNGNDSAVGQMAQQCQALAEMLLQEAEQVEFTKLSIDIQIVILAIQLIIDIATAIVTAGASMGEGAAATMAARLTVRKILLELLKGALMAAAPDFITQTIMLAEGHRSSFNVGETLQAAGSGALGAAVGVGVGHVTGGLAGSLAKGLVGDTADTLGAKLTRGLVNTVNAGVTGALTNMGTTALTDEMSGQSLDNVLSASLSGAGTGLLFHGAHAAGEAIGEASHRAPEPNPRPAFTTDQGAQLQGVQTADNRYALFDQSGAQHGAGTYDPTSGRLDVTPVQGDPYSTHVTIDGSTADQSQTTNEPTVLQPQATDTVPLTAPHDASLASFDLTQNPQSSLEHAPVSPEVTAGHETTVVEPQPQVQTETGPHVDPPVMPPPESPATAQETGVVNQETNAGPQVSLDNAQLSAATGIQAPVRNEDPSVALQPVSGGRQEEGTSASAESTVLPFDPRGHDTSRVENRSAVLSDSAGQGTLHASRTYAPQQRDLLLVAADSGTHGDPNYLHAAANPNVDIARFTPKPAWRTDQAPLWRFEDRGPEEIFNEGFDPFDVDGEYNLDNYILFNHDSPLVSTTRDPDLGYGDRGFQYTAYRYEIDAPHGIDLNATYPDGFRTAWQQEVSFPGGIDRRFVKGVWVRDEASGQFDQWIANPNYDPVPEPTDPPIVSNGPFVGPDPRGHGAQEQTGHRLLVTDENGVHVVVQETVEPENPNVTRPLQTLEGPADPTAPQYAHAERIDLPGIDAAGIGDAVRDPQSPGFEQLWKSLWRATADTSREHAVVQFEDGSHGIVKGGMEGIYQSEPGGDTPPVAKVFMHVHPPWTEARGISPEDAGLLAGTPDQPEAFVIEPGERPQRYFVLDPRLTPGGEPGPLPETLVHSPGTHEDGAQLEATRQQSTQASQNPHEEVAENGRGAAATAPPTPPEPTVRNTIMEALNGHPAGDTPPMPAVDHPANIASVTRDGDHLLLELNDGRRTAWARLDTTGSGFVISALDENGEILRRMAATVGPDEGVFNIFAHADPHGIVVDGMHLPFAQLADRVAGLARDVPIRLYGCDAGAAEAAAELARVSGHDVIAADAPVWLDRNGNVLAASQVDGPAGPRPRLVDDGSGSLTGDGAWKLFHPDGSVSRLAADDPLHPVGRLASPDEELLRLAPDKASVYGFFEDPFFKPAVPDISDVAGRFSLEEVPLRDDTENPRPPRTLNRALQEFAEQKFAGLQKEARYQEILAARRQGGVRTSQPVEYEAAVREANASLPAPERIAGAQRSRRSERLELAGIKVTETWRGESARNIRIETGQGSSSYSGLLDRVGKVRDLFVRQTGSAPAAFDREFAAAVIQLATHPDEPAGRQRLESLGRLMWPGRFQEFPREPDPADTAAVARWRKDADAWNAIEGTEDRPGPASVAFMHMGAQITDLTFSVEGGRHAENLYTNLMVWDLVRNGAMPLEYAFREGNTMGPNSAARITAIADWENADRADPRPRVKQLNLYPARLGPDGVPTEPRSIYANVDEFQRREVEVLARYALRFGGVVGTGDGGAVTVEDLRDYFYRRTVPEVAIKELMMKLYQNLGR